MCECGEVASNLGREISMRGTKLEVLSSFDLNTTSSIIKSGNESMSVSVNRNDHNRSSIDIPVIW